MTATALSPYNVFVTQWAWIDLVLFAAFACLHRSANKASPNLPVAPVSSGQRAAAL
jgi:hypothetical protein